MRFATLCVHFPLAQRRKPTTQSHLDTTNCNVMCNSLNALPPSAAPQAYHPKPPMCVYFRINSHKPLRNRPEAQRANRNLYFWVLFSTNLYFWALVSGNLYFWTLFFTNPYFWALFSRNPYFWPPASRQKRNFTCMPRTGHTQSPQRAAQSQPETSFHLNSAHWTHTISADLGRPRSPRNAISPAFRALDTHDLQRGSHFDWPRRCHLRPIEQ